MRRKDAGRNKKAESVRKIGENSKREEIFQKAGAYFAVFFMAFFIALVSASAFTPVDNSEAATTEVNISGDAGYYFQVVSADTAKMNLTPTADGAQAVAKDTITVRTNSPGYRVYVSMNGNDTNLWKGGSSSSGHSIAAAPSTPAVLTANHWGWALANTSASASNVIQNYGFDMTYCLSSGACSDGNPGSLNTNNKFAGMPTTANPALVMYSTAKAESGATQDIYYGVNASTALESGNYLGTVIYTAVGEATEAMNGTITFNTDNQQVLEGQSRVIATSLYASQALVDAIPASDVSVTIDGKACTNPALSVASGAVNVTCTTPTMTKWGTYDVAVAIGSYGAFTATNGYSYYIPYDTINQAPAGRYTMQQFTSKTCDEMPTPAAYTGDGKTLNDNYRVVGSYADKSVPSWYDRGANGAPVVTTTNPVKQVILTDSRDGRTYQVRKYADGNCWMAQNLELTFLNSDNNYSDNITDKAAKIRMADGSAGGTTLTPVDTDINSNSNNVNVNLFHATQKVAGVSYPWADDGHNESRSFSHAAYKSGSELYAVEQATKDPNTGQLQYTVQATKGTYDGEETRGGNLYNWTQATLASGEALTTDGQEAADSICPANWQLPTNSMGLTNSRGKNYSIRNLLQTYYTGTYRTGNPQDGSLAYQEELVWEQNLLRSEPISMVVSGFYSRSGGTLNGRNTRGGYVWSSTAGSAIHARGLNPNPTGFDPQNLGYRGYGYTVRCVSR